MFKKITVQISRQIKLFSNLRHISVTPKASNDVALKTTVNKNEIDLFKKYADEWWDELGPFKPLHSLNSLRVPFIRDGIIHSSKVSKDIVNSPKPLSNIKIIDVGCGAGILSESLARLGAKVTGLDAATDLIECAKQHAKKDAKIAGNIDFISSSIEVFSESNKDKYDAIVASEVIEHVDHPEVFVKHCVKVLKPGGSIFLTTMNKTMWSWAACIVVAEYITQQIPRGTHDWNKFIPVNQLQKMLEHNQCRTKVIHGMVYNLIINKWYWISNTSNNYAIHAIKK